MLIPSKVLVPRPISSSMTRLLGVAFCRMCAVSTISTMKVDCPAVRLSDAPTLENIRSTTPRRAARAGTKLPIWAISDISATCLMRVDLPAMLGPVMIMKRSASESRVTSFGTKPLSRLILSTTGWRQSLSSIVGCGANSGRQ